MDSAISLSKLLTKIWTDLKSAYKNKNGIDSFMVEIYFNFTIISLKVIKFQIKQVDKLNRMHK